MSTTAPEPIIIRPDPEPGDAPDLTVRPDGDAGRMWDIVVKWRIGSDNPAADWWSAQKTVEKVAKNKKVDPALLMAVLVARFGDKRPGGDLQKQIGQVGNTLRKKPKDVGLNDWFSRNFKNAKGRLKPNVYTQRVKGGVTFPSPSAGSGTTDSISDVFDTLPNGKAWAAVWPQIQRQAGISRVNRNGVDFRVEPEELLAALAARGFAPKRLKLANISAVADSFGNRDAFVSLDEWFEETWGPAKGPGSPDEILANTLRTVPQTGADKAKSDKAEKDFSDPVVKGPNGEPFSIGGQDLRTSQFRALKGKYDDLSQFYRNRKATKNEVLRWTKSGISDHQLAVELTRDKDFFRSPAWKGASVSYKSVFRDMIGQNAKLPKGLVRKAIVLKWSPGEFAEELRGRPEFLKSNEFNSQAASLQNIYSTVMGGQITPGVKTAIKEATLARWSPDQFAAWLRQQPEYATGVEHQKKTRHLRRGLAAAFGTTMKRVEAPIPEPVAAFDLPDSQRIQGTGTLASDQEFEAQGSQFVKQPREAGAA